jgi:hypothetical protein
MCAHIPEKNNHVIYEQKSTFEIIPRARGHDPFSHRGDAARTMNGHVAVMQIVVVVVVVEDARSCCQSPAHFSLSRAYGCE